MTIYTITNPHDPYTLIAPDLATAAAATLLLGDGYHGLKDDLGNSVMPILFLASMVDSWHESTFGCNAMENFKRVGFNAVADCLDTVLLGSMSDRRVYERAVRECRPEAIDDLKQAYADLYKPRSLTDLRAITKQKAARAREIAKEQYEENPT